MNKYKLDQDYTKFLIRCIICFSLLLVSWFLYVLWLPFCDIEVIKNYIMELLGRFLGFAIIVTITFFSFCTVIYIILYVIKTILQVKREDFRKLLKSPVFVLVSVLVPIAIFFSVYFFLNIAKIWDYIFYYLI